ncbi:sensor histidine kinase [Pseudoalteromonas sp. P1-25]|uniref:sensor histidine kinase n=1 Tax=Pseudoalteromonas sp. P1-25 TaxID=1723758 RepID=UPI0006D68A88|nr:ATP-binding protein [Pseudoalteromonas sp. P1-25]KPZ51618.1 Sensor protein ZraS [Pseudoalteromonas sp. P1-25]
MSTVTKDYKQAFLDEQRKRLAAEQLLEDKSQLLVVLNNELNKNAAELSLYQQMFVQADKMASVGDLSCSIAHEINNPLSYVISNIESLQYISPLLSKSLHYNEQFLTGQLNAGQYKNVLADLKKQYEHAWNVHEIYSQLSESLEGLKRIKQTVHNLLNLSQFTYSHNKQYLDVSEVACSALEVLQGQLKYCEIKTNFEQLPLIWGELSSIHQIFVELLLNAQQACAHDLEKGSIIDLSVTQQNEGVCIKVKDNGCGMDENTQMHLFKPFFSTKNTAHSLGIGMTVVNFILQEHGGKIEVSSTLGTGTTICCWLPVKAEESAINLL